MEPAPTPFSYDRNSLDKYLNMTLSARGKRPVRTLYPEASTKQKLLECLCGDLWKKGHFTLDCIRLKAAWKWNGKPVGNVAAFYNSVRALAEYMFPTGVKISKPSFSMYESECDVEFEIDKVVLPEEADEEISSAPDISDARACPSGALDIRDSWLVYIPFDTCSYRLGGSLLAEKRGHDGGVGPDIYDLDYFMDCCELVRELVEDGVVLAGMTVADGGLATAMGRFCENCGAGMDISGIKEALGESDSVKVAFGEVPGVLIQIADEEFDYLDSQMLLQDVAYYPLGHPRGNGKLTI